jgi:hypothetical protein
LQTNLPPTFAISSQINSAREGSGQRATLAVVSSRQGPLEVGYSLRDPSANGVAFENLSGQLTIPPGANAVQIEIRPIDNSTASAPTIVTVTLAQSGVIQNSASVILFDDEQLGQGLKKEVFAAVAGTAVKDLLDDFRYPGRAQLSTVPVFEASLSQGSGQVLSGFLTPPMTGLYTFYLAAANGAELWLSSDASPGNAVRIAAELGTNTKRNWQGYGSNSHISAPVHLLHGRWYNVRAMHKAGFGTPHLAVAWQAPNEGAPAAGSAPIGGEHLTWALPEPAVQSWASVRLVSSSTGGLLLVFESPQAVPLVLEASSDLRQWQPVLTSDALHGIDLRQVDAAAATSPVRFYRLIAPLP